MSKPEFDADGFNADVGARLRHHRRRVGKSQAEVAVEVGISRAAIANIENGRQRIPADILWRAAIVVGVPFVKLIPEPMRLTGEKPR